MTGITFEKTGPQLSIELLNDVQIRCRVRFPPDYISLMLESNGGTPPRTLYKGQDWDLALDRIYPIMDGEFSFEGYLANDRKYRSMPNDLYSIGSTAEGHSICLSQGETDFGAVYLWIHDTARNPKKYVAPSLSVVLQNLEPYDW